VPAFLYLVLATPSLGVSTVLLIANRMMIARTALRHEAELLAVNEKASVGEDVTAD